MVYNFIGMAMGLVGVGLLIVLGFGALQWLQIPVGSLLDWLIGSASFLWLLAIVTVPWNIYFKAKETLADAELSMARSVEVSPQQMAYVQRLARRSRNVAIALHLLSAVGLYALSATGITVVGYISSGAALLLTGLRPAIAAYHYFSVRLAQIQQGFNYPREDVLELRDRVLTLETQTKAFQEQLDLEQPYSFAATERRNREELQQEVARLAASQRDLEATNQRDHERLARESRQAIAQLSTDGQFLDHVREIIRFFKAA